MNGNPKNPNNRPHMPKPNLHPCYCPWCHKDLDTFADLKNEDRVFKCGECQNHFTGPAWPGKCPVCSAPPGKQTFLRRLSPTDKVPSVPCADCMVKQNQMDEAVIKGGIRFQCIDCGLDGVFSAATPFAQKVRADLNKPAPEDVHVQIQNCPQCVERKANDTPGITGLDKDTATQMLADIVAAGDNGEVTVDLLDDTTEFAQAWDNAVDGTTPLPPVAYTKLSDDLDNLVDDIMQSR